VETDKRKVSLRFRDVAKIFSVPKGYLPQAKKFGELHGNLEIYEVEFVVLKRMPHSSVEEHSYLSVLSERSKDRIRLVDTKLPNWF